MTDTVTVLWTAGHGMRGYLPESSPFLTTSWGSAKDSTVEDLGHANGLADYYSQGLPTEALDWLEENHTHRWGELEQSRLAGTVHRKCTVAGCDVICALDDEDDPTNEQEPGEATKLYEYRQSEFENLLPFTLEDYQWDMVKGLAQAEDAIRELEKLEPDTEWDGWIGDFHYWISTSDRSANDIPATAEGEELEQIIDTLNEQGW